MNILTTHLNDLLLQVALAGFLFFLVERLRPIHKNLRFFKSELGQDLALAVINAGLVIPMTLILIYLFFDTWVTPYVEIPFLHDAIKGLPLIAQVALGVLILDFIVYWRHKFTHYYMWRFHAIHHSAQEISWSTKLRLHPIDIVVAVTCQSVVLFLMGFPPESLLAASTIVTVIDYINHSNTDFGFKGPMRYVLATPRYHRWHHAEEKEAQNKNFVVCFPFIDLIFGSYYYPVDALPQTYGIGRKSQALYPVSVIGQFLYPFQKKR